MTTEQDWGNWERDALKSLAEAIRRTRKERGLSQTELAERACVSKGLIVNLESAAGDKPRIDSMPTVTTLVKIALAVGHPPIELLYPKQLHGEVDIWPGIRTNSFVAAQWFSGEKSASEVIRLPMTEGSTNALMAKARTYRRKAEEYHNYLAHGLEVFTRNAKDMARQMDPPMTEAEANQFVEGARQRWLEKVRSDRERLEQMKSEVRDLGGVVRDDDQS